MTNTSLAQGKATEKVAGERTCFRCGEPGTLVAPERLPYEEAKEYRGPMHHLSCSPRFDGRSLDKVRLG